MDTIKAVIDTDPGADDALALMVALGAPRLNVLGLTTVGGNASLANTTRNALRLLHYLDVKGGEKTYQRGVDVQRLCQGNGPAIMSVVAVSSQ